MSRKAGYIYSAVVLFTIDFIALVWIFALFLLAFNEGPDASEWYRPMITPPLILFIVCIVLGMFFQVRAFREKE